jgi:hypothetical protein
MKIIRTHLFKGDFQKLPDNIKRSAEKALRMLLNELRINKGTLYLSLMGRGNFSRPDYGRLKPPLPRMNAQKTSSITFARFNN